MPSDNSLNERCGATALRWGESTSDEMRFGRLLGGDLLDHTLHLGLSSLLLGCALELLDLFDDNLFDNLISGFLFITRETVAQALDALADGGTEFGRFLGPKIKRTTTKMITSSGTPRPRIFISQTSTLMKQRGSRLPRRNLPVATARISCRRRIAS